MNTELKAMLAVVFKMFALGEDLILKAPLTKDVTDGEALMLGIPAIVAGWGNIQSEVQALENPANIADILGFIAAQFVSVNSDAHAQAILNASLKIAEDLAVDGIGLVAAIKG